MPFNLEKLWYGRHPLRWFFWPFSLAYQGMVSFRRYCLRSFFQQHFTVPVVVVGNLTVGGVGKTPLVIALVKAFQAKGVRVGVVSRGYGAAISAFPYEVNQRDNPEQVGDEPLLLAKKCACPVVIAPRRVDAVQYLVETHKSQVIISDDGLQHYAMGRSLEIVVIDGQRGMGNGMCLPAGPLRETVSRLQTVDLVVVNEGHWPGAYPMSFTPGPLTHLVTGQVMKLSDLPEPIAAVAGIGHPARFFSTLTDLGVSFRPYPFPDHHAFVPVDFSMREKSVVMTEKDAVKCQWFAADNWYFLAIEAKLSDAFWEALWSHEQLKGYL